MHYSDCLKIGLSGLMLTLAPIAWAQPDIASIKLYIEQQYEAIDEAMLSRPYHTHTEFQRRDEPARIEATHFDPDRPTGEREHLLRVDNRAPSSSEQRQFNRRPQPDERDEQPIRLKIPYAELELVHWQGEDVVFAFTPTLRLDDEVSELGHLFRGELIWDQSQQKIREVRMWLTESFRYRIVQVHEFTVHETFQWVDAVLMREQYHHDIDLRNFWLNLSNRITIQFDYDL
jgi:hypothetical protein